MQITRRPGNSAIGLLAVMGNISTPAASAPLPAQSHLSAGLRDHPPTEPAASRAGRRHGAWVIVILLAAVAALVSGVLLPIAAADPLVAAAGHRIAIAAPAVSELVDPEPGVEDGNPGYGESMSPIDDDLPAIANLDPDLRTAMQDAAREAHSEGVDFHLKSGWRSVSFQQWLLDDAIAQYGSAEEASRYVSTPEKSRHVSGEAVDIGPTEGSYWMSANGFRFGLCQIYSNEIWHYELVTTPGGRCPDLLEDASAG